MTVYEELKSKDIHRRKLYKQICDELSDLLSEKFGNGHAMVETNTSMHNGIVSTSAILEYGNGYDVKFSEYTIPFDIELLRDNLFLFIIYSDIPDNNNRLELELKTDTYRTQLSKVADMLVEALKIKVSIK